MYESYIIIALSISTGLLLGKCLLYRKTIHDLRTRVSWQMPNALPRYWAVIKNFHRGKDDVTYDVADSETNIRIATDFRSETAAREYIEQHKKEVGSDS